MEPRGSTRINTIQIGFEQELSQYLKSIQSNQFKKPDRLKSGQPKHVEKLAKRSDFLLNVWNSYEGKLDKNYFQEKLLVLGDTLYTLQEYQQAAKHCYHKHLGNCSEDLLMGPSDGDFSKFESNYFGTNFQPEESIPTMKALLGAAVCYSLDRIARDAKLQSPENVPFIIRMLKVIQMTTQVALKHESLYWMVYNGTVHIYTVCRKLIELGHSRHVLVYLIWSCVCMESSVPLMTVKCLPWRTQLYTSVCQCYYNVNLGEEAETFAKRALNKIQELQEIEQASSTFSEVSNGVMKQCRMRLNLMVFKRNVFESRRRPKGILRPKNKPNLKDIAHNPWPRTASERMLADLFPCRAAQMLAILEALSDSTHRLLYSISGANDMDDSMLDVYSELFFAGCEIIAGGGGVHPATTGRHDTPVGALIENSSLMKLAMEGKDSITLMSLVHFSTVAFRLENFEVFDLFYETCLNVLSKENAPPAYKMARKELEIYHALSILLSGKNRKKVTLPFDEKDGEGHKTSTGKHFTQIDELLSLAKIVQTCYEDKHLCTFPGDIANTLVDAVLFLWSKTKLHFSRVTSLLVETAKSFAQDDNFAKWFQILTITQEAMIKFRITDTDPGCCAEASIKLAFILEIIHCFADVIDSSDSRLDLSGSRISNENTRTEMSRTSTILEETKCSVSSSWLPSPFWCNSELLLKQASYLLENCITAIHESAERRRETMTATHQSGANETKTSDTETGEELEEDIPSFALNTSSMYLELIIIYYRICHRLSSSPFSDKISKQTKSSSKLESKTGKHLSSSTDVLYKPGKNPLLQALDRVCTAEVSTNMRKEEQTRLLEESFSLVLKSRQTARKFAKEEAETSADDLPRAPELVSQGATFMVFKPADYKPRNGAKVTWYRLYVRSASGNNVKVRLSDTVYEGTGEEVLNSPDCTLTVRNLDPNERYVAALAAFDAKGGILGGAIGQSTRPILALQAVPHLNLYGYLAKVAFEIKAVEIVKKVCDTLYTHFVEVAPPEKEYYGVSSANEDFRLRSQRLKQESMKSVSVITIRYFIQSVFLSVEQEINIQGLHCDSLTDMGPLIDGQIARLMECEKLMMVIQAGGWINDNSICLQAIVMSYGLLAPIIQTKIRCRPATQILLTCFGTLQEVYPLLKQRKHGGFMENIQHMILCMIYYIAKNLELVKTKKDAVTLLEKGMQLLSLESVPRSATTSHASEAGIYTHDRKPKRKQTQRKQKYPTKGGKGNVDLSGSDSGMVDVKALDAYLNRLSRHSGLSHEDETTELNGSEDSPILHAVISSLPPQQAFKEVFKFRRRTLFLQHFVTILSKACKEGLHDLIMEQAKEAQHWLSRRNDILMNKVQSNKPGAGVVSGEDDKIKKYSAAVVEYGKPSKRFVAKDLTPAVQEETHENDTENHKQHSAISQQSKDVKKELDEDRIERKSKESSQSYGARKFEKATKKGVFLTDFEKETKEAMMKLQQVLPEHWQTSQRRRKLRSVSSEELPWRSQMNYTVALSLIDQTQAKLMKVIKTVHNTRKSDNRSFLDTSMFFMPISDMLIVSWHGNLSATTEDVRQTPDRGGQRVEHVSDLNQSYDRGSIAQGFAYAGLDTSRSGHPGSNLQGYKTETSDYSGEIAKGFYDSLNASLMYLRRAIVLSHRAHKWELLQNSCVEFFNLVNSILRLVIQLKSSVDVATQQCPVDLAGIRQVFWKDMYIASDCLLDMLSILSQPDTCATSKDQITPNYKDLYGTAIDQQGGLSLKFDPHLDNASKVNLNFVRQFILYSTEFLYHEEKWERLCDVVYRFNILSRDRFAESLIPILIVAQKRLKGRIDSITHLDTQPQVEYDEKTGILLKVRFNPGIKSPIDVGEVLDPKAPNMYKQKRDGLRRTAIRLDTRESYSQFFEALEKKHHTARAIEHSRKLFFLYLVGQWGGDEDVARLKYGTSSVSFAADQVKPPSDMPMEILGDEIISTEEIENFPLNSSYLGTVISSYEKTIELLQYHQKKGLSIQAMHELGNLKFHASNIRAAYQYWADALDAILKKKNAIRTWRNMLISSDESIFKNKGFLQIAGIWACILGGVLACKIARYIHTTDFSARIEYCNLSAAFFTALLCSALPHPSMYIEYALYEFGPGNPTRDLIPGIDLFGDYFRTDAVSFLACLVWTSQQLLRSSHYLKALPLLSIGQHVANVICNDVKMAVRIKLLRVFALLNLQMHSEAIEHLNDVLYHRKLPQLLPGQPKFIYTRPPKTFRSDSKVSDNAEALHNLATFKLSALQSDVLGPQICGRILLTQAQVLVSIAEAISGIADTMSERDQPTKEEPKEPRKANSKLGTSITPQKSSSRRRKAKSTLDASHTVVIPVQARPKDFKSFTQQQLKGYLLAKAEALLLLIPDTLGQTQDKVKSSEVYEVLCLHKLELAKVDFQRLFVHTAAYHCFEASHLLTKLPFHSSVDERDHSPSTADDSDNSFAYADARSQPDSQLWLTCRLMLAYTLSSADAAIGNLNEPTRNTTDVIGTCKCHIIQGLAEAQAFASVEAECTFLYLQVLEDLRTGEELHSIISVIKTVLDKLSNLRSLSEDGFLLLIKTELLDGDIDTRSAKTEQDIQECVQKYLHIQMMILRKLEMVGVNIDGQYLVPANPLQCCYSNLVPWLVMVKLRLCRLRGYLLSAEIIKVEKKTELQNIIRELDVVISLSKQSFMISPYLSVEAYHLKGQLMLMHFECGTETVEPEDVMTALLHAVMISAQQVEDLSLMRQVYLDLGMVNLFAASKYNPQVNPNKEKYIDSQPRSPSPQQAKSKVTKQQQRAAAAKREKEEKSRERQRQKFLRAAWVAIRTAGAIAKAQKKINVLTGEPSVTSQSLDPDSCVSMPLPVVHDLLGTNAVVGNGDETSLVQSGGKVAVTTPFKEGKVDHVVLTWLHMINLWSHHKRATQLVMSDHKKGVLGPMTRFFPDSNERRLRLMQLHQYLQQHLLVFERECCPILPIEFFIQTFDLKIDQVAQGISNQSGAANTETKDEALKQATPEPEGDEKKFQDVVQEPTQSVTEYLMDGIPRQPSPEKHAKRGDRVHTRDPLQAAEFEVAMQWYSPELKFKSSHDEQNASKWLLYAMNSKAVASKAPSNAFGSNCVAGYKKEIAVDIEALHHDFLEVLHLAEADLVPVQGQSSRTSVAFQTVAALSVQTKKKKTATSKGPVIPTDREENIRAHLKKALEKLVQLHHKAAADDKGDLPFALTLQNISCLESLFNPSYGYITRSSDNFYHWLSMLLDVKL